MSDGVTRDSLFHGKLELSQPAAGYRVNVDALLIAAFAARGRRAGLAVDLGAGVGTIGLALHVVGAAQSLTLVEREPHLAALARENLANCGARGEVLELDLAERRLPRALAQRADLVVCNPPFFPASTGRRPAHPLNARSRTGELAPFVVAAARALRGARARAVFAYPARALAELFAAVAQAGLVAKRLRLVHARTDEAARLALVELRRAKPGALVVEAPLVEWAGPRQRTPELKAIVAGRFGPRAAP